MKAPGVFLISFIHTGEVMAAWIPLGTGLFVGALTFAMAPVSDV